jgi:uncharacterized C2H2 Zn-finger protein
MCGRDINCEDVKWVEQAQGRGVWQALVLAELVKAYKLQWISLLSTEKQPHTDCLLPGEWCFQRGASMLRDILSGAEDDEVNHNQDMSRSGKRVWKCGRCGNSYNYKSSLTRHVKMECGQEPKHECPICMKMYTYKHVLKDHLQLVHGQIYRKNGHWAPSGVTSRENESDDISLS